MPKRTKPVQPPGCAYLLRGLACRNARPGEQCGCVLNALRAAAAGVPAAEALVERAARSPDLAPPAPRLDELRDVLELLQQADSDLTGLRPETAQQTLRDAIRVLAGELGSNATTPQQAYAARVAAQSARIDAYLNERGRKRKTKR